MNIRKTGSSGHRPLRRLTAALCAAAAGCTLYLSALAGPDAAWPDAPDGEAVQNGLHTVARTDQLELQYDGTAGSIAVLDKRSGYRWNSGVDTERISGDVNDFWLGNMTSLFTFSYTNLDKSAKASTSNTNAVQEESKITETALDNGIRLQYVFSKLGIRLAVELTLEEDRLIVRIPQDSIREQKNNKLVSISVLPFFGASPEANGYAVYPDGSGALHRFTGQEKTGGSALKLDIYGSRILDLDTRQTDREQGVKTAMLPIFGVQRDGEAFVAIIEDEACESTVEVYPNGLNVAYDRIYNTFTYRRTYSSVKPSMESGTVQVTKIDEELVQGDRTVSYAFLPGGGYSEMAGRYREYLLRSGGVARRIGKDDAVPLQLDLLMGATETSMLADRFVTMCTFRQAQDMLEDLTGEGITALRVNLAGWQNSGYGAYPQGFPPASKLGGDKALAELNAYAREKRIPLTLQNNLVDADETNGGFTKRRDCVYTRGRVLLTDAAGSRYLFSPVTALSRFEEAFLPSARKAGAGGLCFEVFGEQLLADYRENAALSRGENRKVWESFLRQTKETLGYCAVTGGNSYVFPYVDALLQVPVRDSGYFLTDETIPLYQMVVHGLIPYTAEEPENLFYDTKKQKLRLIEYGCIPYFMLTHASSEDVKYTDGHFLFTSQYAKWKAAAVESWNEWNGRLKAFYHLTIREHVRLEDELIRVTYEDGSRIYLNYGGETAEIDGLTIPAEDYRTVEVES